MSRKSAWDILVQSTASTYPAWSLLRSLLRLRRLGRARSSEQMVVLFAAISLCDEKRENVCVSTTAAGCGSGRFDVTACTGHLCNARR